MRSRWCDFASSDVIVARDDPAAVERTAVTDVRAIAVAERKEFLGLISDSGRLARRAH